VTRTAARPTADFSHINEDLAAADDAGAMITVAAGDLDNAMGYPAVRPEVISVGWAVSTPGTAADTAPHTPGSGIGPLPINVYGEGPRTTSGQGVLAPGDVQLIEIWNAAAIPEGIVLYDPTTGYPGNAYIAGPWDFGGASLSAPLVAGATAIMVQAYANNGWRPNGWHLKAAMLAQGDGFNEYSAPSQLESSGVTSQTGYGHVHMHYPRGDGNLPGAWGWGNDTFTLATGQDHYIQWGVLPAGATEWKAAVVWNETDPANVADIDVSVETLGTGNCNQTPVTLAMQDDYDLHQRLTLTGSQVANQCIRLKIHGYSVPPAGRTIYSVNYWHGGTID
jgi:hypothetical protein